MFYMLCGCSLFLDYFFFFFKQKTAYEMRISDWSSDVCSSDLHVSGSFSLTREEVGNSGSPVNGDIDPTPLPTPSDDSESSAGDLMTSNIEPIPQGGLDLESSASSISC